MKQLKKGYKKTEVGVIPEDWEVITLNDAVKDFQLGGNYSNGENETNFPLIKMGNIDRGEIKLDKIYYVVGAKPSDKDRLKYGDVLFNTRNTLELVGKVAIWRNELPVAYYNSNLLRLDFNESKISSNFFFNYLINTKRNIAQLKTLATGTTSVAAIYTRDLIKINIAKPTLTEQKAIADSLTDVDELITNLEKLIAKKKAIKQGAMQQLLTPPHKGGKRLEGFSGDWEEIDISSLAHIVGGGTPSTSNFEFWNGNINWFTPTEIGDVKYSIESFRKISAEGLKSSSARMLPKGTVLMTTRASIGDLSILECDACTNQGFQSLVPIDKNDSEFIYYIMSTLKKSMLNLSSGSTFLEISPNKLKLLRFFIPISIDERQAIANVLKQIDDEIGLLLKRKDKLMQIKQGMMQELLTGKTRLI